MKLTPEEKQFLIQKIASEEAIPDDFREKLFPTLQKEYELRYAGKMRREDLLADQDGTFAVPFQLERVFNGERELFEDGWRNMIVFGDNLQFLKTCYADKDESIRNRIKGKVKLIYIDPPFGTGEEYDGNKGQKGYSAKAKGADFVEFLRRRLLLAKELLSSNGFIVVRQAFNFGHYIKIVLDEVFGKDNFINEVSIGRKREGAGTRKKLDVTNESLFIYAKTNDYTINQVVAKRAISDISWTSFLMADERNPKERVFLGKTLTPPKGQHFSLVQDKCNKLIQENFLRLRCKSCAALYYNASSQEELDKRLKHKKHKFKFYDISSDTDYYAVEAVELCLNCGNDNFTVDYLGADEARISNNWLDIRSYSSTTGYPTENSEELLSRVIQATTNPNELVMDFFGGSGTTAAVAEKLCRRWIICDIGKLSFYTMQKRLLTIQDSKNLEQPTKKYGKKARTFITVNTGLYDLEKLNQLNKEKYIDFVLRLFEVERKPSKVSGIKLHGERKDGYNVLVWEYWKEEGAKVDEVFLEDLHRQVGKRIGARLYIIAPANAVQFIGDFHEIDDVRYYFLKIPYQVIKELHRAPFAKFRQPQSKSKVNDLDDAIGFHFMRQPEVESQFKKGKLYITKFLSNVKDEGTSVKSFANFETLAMLILDENYNGSEFVMTSFHFAADLIHVPADETDEELRVHLKEQTQIAVPLKDVGTTVVAIYVDIFGNEFKQEIKTR
jgi:site-specific DNA-methyltransferase (adenine-specific)/adenine-specific DNA-methyltransferase